MTTNFGQALSATIAHISHDQRRLHDLCRITGPLSQPWAKIPAVAEFLDTEKFPHRERAAWRLILKAERWLEDQKAQLRLRYDQAVGSARFAALRVSAQHYFTALHARAQGEGPSVLAPARQMAVIIHRLTGHRYSLKQMTLCRRDLEDAGLITSTPGAAWRDGEKPRATICHLLSGDYYTYQAGTRGSVCVAAQARGPSRDLVVLAVRAVREAFVLVRRLKFVFAGRIQFIPEHELFPGPLTS